MSEWPRNPLGSACNGSSPFGVLASRTQCPDVRLGLSEDFVKSFAVNVMGRFEMLLG